MDVGVYESFNDVPGRDSAAIDDIIEQQQDRALSPHWLSVVDSICGEVGARSVFHVFRSRGEVVGCAQSALIPRFPLAQLPLLNRPVHARLNYAMMPLANYSPFLFRDQLRRPEALELFLETIPWRRWSDLIVLGPLFDADTALRKAAPPHLCAVPYYQVAYLDIDFSSFEEYVGVLKKKRRQEVKKNQRAFREYGAVLSRCASSEKISDRLDELLQNVIARKDDDGIPFRMTKAAFLDISSRLGKDYEIFTATYDDEVIAFCFALRRGPVLEAKFIAQDYSHSAASMAYFNLQYEVIRYCAEEGVKRAYFGVTTLPVKRKLGCKFADATMYIGSPRSPINHVLRAGGIVSDSMFSGHEE